jgi:hypothetical protein
MSKATLNLASPVTVSKLDTTDWSRELWLAAYAMARRMIRDRASHGIGAAWTWYLQHARRRFTTPAAWRIAQLAGRVAFDARTVTHTRAGSVAELERQGLVRRTRRPRPGNLTGTVAYRAVSFERLCGHGFSMAWTYDPLASGSNRGLRVHRAKKLRAERRAILAEVRAEERQVAMIMAEDRFTLTQKGLAALRAARMA